MAAVAAVSLGWAASAVAVDPTPTPTDVLNSLQQPGVQALTGTVVTTADLGLPNVPIDLLELPVPLEAGPSEVAVQVWVDGSERQRVTVIADPADTSPVPVQETEASAWRDGDTAWVWSKEEATATRYALADGRGADVFPELSGPLTPDQVTRKILEYLDGNTDVKVAESEQVAGRDAVALVLTPRDANTTISQVTIAVDSETYVPLSVRVGSTRLATPAIETTFTSLEYGTPKPEAFEFSPPEGATVVERDGSSPAGPKGELPAVVGEGWSSVAVGSFSLADLATTDAMTRLSEGQSEAAMALLRSYLELPRISDGWGSGRLLERNPFSAVITDDRLYAVGTVDGDALAAALGQRTTSTP